MNKVRIAKYLADCGLGSRRKCEQLILDGKIKVNGRPVDELSLKVGGQDQVCYLDRKVYPQAKLVIALNKPGGYLSTVKDDFKRKKVTDLIDLEERLYPVGRLDYNSRGLLIMTNDGYLAYQITHPKFGIPKTYRVKIKGFIDDSRLQRINKGIEIEDREVAILSTRVLKRNPDYSLIDLRLVEGRKRIIRRVFKKLGYQVQDLIRTKIGKYDLGDLKEGQYKILDSRQVKKLVSK
ncbi:MAG: pseudouridine synthase [Actinomycetota bacterium]|nr:pseudouridine synthase [Actinomycetota bacterium]